MFRKTLLFSGQAEDQQFLPPAALSTLPRARLLAPPQPVTRPGARDAGVRRGSRSVLEAWRGPEAKLDRPLRVRPDFHLTI